VGAGLQPPITRFLHGIFSRVRYRIFRLWASVCRDKIKVKFGQKIVLRESTLKKFPYGKLLKKPTPKIFIFILQSIMDINSAFERECKTEANFILNVKIFQGIKSVINFYHLVYHGQSRNIKKHKKPHIFANHRIFWCLICHWLQFWMPFPVLYCTKIISWTIKSQQGCRNNS